MVTPIPPVRATARLAATLGPAGLIEFARLALQPVRRLTDERFAGAGAARLLAGNALHADLTPESTLSGFFGFLLVALGQDVGFPFPEGGAGRLAEAMIRRLRARGGKLTCGARVEQVLVRRGRAVGVRLADGSAVGARRAVLADVDAPSLFLKLVGEEHLPARVLRAIRRFQWDPATFKVDWTLDGRIPWAAEQARRSPVLHLADSIDHLSTWSSSLASGRMPERPFLLFGQYALADETRSPVGKDTAWSYTHVPYGETWDEQRTAAFADRIEEVVESYAPGFRLLIRGRHIMAPHDLESRDSNLVGGSLNGGTAQLHQQLVFRPIPGLGRSETPVGRLYLASASAHPGGGVHGAPGAIAARAALNAERARRRVLIAGAAAALAVARRP
jgi:phytoene dehydrogenase-like protein